MERFTIDEVIEHCKRKVAYCEKLQGKQSLENSDIEKTIVKEYWEHRQVGEWLETLKSYKEIGLTPDQIREVDKLYSELCKELGTYKKLEVQGKLMRRGARVRDLIGVLFSHNECVALWREAEPATKECIWRGMAWNIPEKYRECEFARIFGTIPIRLSDADAINVVIKVEIDEDSTDMKEV